jgi:Bacterial Ig-like domain (group 2)
MPPRTLRAARAALLLAAGALAACGDATGGPAEAKLHFSASVAGTRTAALVVEVAAPDIAGRLAFNVPVEGGAASATLAVPVGAARTVSVRAFDGAGAETHRGARTVDVSAGANPPLSLTLLPVDAGQPPITATLGSVIVTVTPAQASLARGDTLRLTAAVRDTDGRAVAAEVQWATLHPAHATVDRHGLVTAREPGEAEVVAVYAGVAARARLQVTAP